MTIPNTTVFPVRNYLITQLSAAVPAGTEVFDAENTQPDREDWVLVGGARRTVGALAMVGNGGQFWRDERYQVDVTIETFTAGRNGFEDSYNRAYALLETLESVVRQDPSLGGLVLQANPKSSSDTPTWDPTGQGAIVTITTSIEVYTTL